MKESGDVAAVDMWFHLWLTFARMHFDSCGGCACI